VLRAASLAKETRRDGIDSHGSAHQDYEASFLGGARDQQWAGWYSAYVLGRLGGFTASAVTALLPRAQFSTHFATSFFGTVKPSPLKQCPTFKMITPIPLILEPPEQRSFPFRCNFDVKKETKRVRAAKGTFTSELIVRDNKS